MSLMQDYKKMIVIVIFTAAATAAGSTTTTSTTTWLRSFPLKSCQDSVVPEFTYVMNITCCPFSKFPM
jgi:hypothetical protein